MVINSAEKDILSLLRLYYYVYNESLEYFEVGESIRFTIVTLGN